MKPETELDELKLELRGLKHILNVNKMSGNTGSNLPQMKESARKRIPIVEARIQELIEIIRKQKQDDRDENMDKLLHLLVKHYQALLGEGEPLERDEVFFVRTMQKNRVIAKLIRV